MILCLVTGKYYPITYLFMVVFVPAQTFKIKFTEGKIIIINFIEPFIFKIMFAQSLLDTKKWYFQQTFQWNLVNCFMIKGKPSFMWCEMVSFLQYG